VPNWGMMAFFNFIKNVFDKTIGDQQFDEPVENKSPVVEVPKSNDEQKPRQWKAELYEYFIDHLLTVWNFDPNGLTEKLTIAWATPSCRRLRRESGRCWGPYGLFYNPYNSEESFRAACFLDFGATLVSLGLAILILRPRFFPITLILISVGLYLIVYNMPNIDYWNDECGGGDRPDSVLKQYNTYVSFCSNFHKEEV